MTLELFVMRRAGGNVEPRLRQTRSGDCTILSVVGSLDQRILSDFAYQADHALTQGTHLVLDITGATRIDSSVLGTLLNLSKRAEYAEREIRLVGLNGRVRSALRLARAESLFQSYPSLADALIGSESEPLDIEAEFNETDAVLTLRGSADKLQTTALEARLQSLPASLQNLDLDLRGVTYIDCGMLSLLGRLSTQWTQANRSLRVIPNVVVTRTLVREKLTGLLHLSETPRQVVTPRMALRA
jgi:anti-anti-sigma factor